MRGSKGLLALKDQYVRIIDEDVKLLVHVYLKRTRSLGWVKQRLTSAANRITQRTLVVYKEHERFLKENQTNDRERKKKKREKE